jgi:hypothetical protein
VNVFTFSDAIVISPRWADLAAGRSDQRDD